MVIVCEYSICDGLSLSNAAHELLQILSDETGHACEEPLSWGKTMEDAIKSSRSAVNRAFILNRFLFSAICTHISNRLPVAHVVFGEVDFKINEMEKYCHTEAVYGVLNKEMTAKLFTRCRREGVTITSAVISAILSTTASFVSIKDGQDSVMIVSLSADTRRRCIPPVLNHDLSYHASGIGPFGLPVSSAPKTPEGSWQLAHTYGQHTRLRFDHSEDLRKIIRSNQYGLHTNIFRF